ncbi:MAG: hypothetical protein QG580_249 [Patescibacteria group bacterium]|jgi:Na+/H+ antiporter NhaD/arsenite permease-like protein|nr:hypothetical protein [Patescibacteria group bacterium]
MDTLQITLSVIFVLGYAAIALEHPLRLNKAAPAVFISFLIWTILALVYGDEMAHSFSHHMVDVGNILFFLIGAMAIVEVIDIHEGFRIITDRIKATSRIKLYWLIGGISFCLSAVLDNLTTSIVMVALLNKFVAKQEDKWTLAGLVIIAANAGGAWSPIGDVTTIMLWVGGQVTAMGVIKSLLLPSIVCLVVAILTLSFTTSGPIEQVTHKEGPEGGTSHLERWEKNTVFWLGIVSLISVPVFKNYTHLPPFLGIMGGLGVLVSFTEFIHNRHPKWKARQHMTISSVLGRIDHTSILFFLGILLAVGGLGTSGVLALTGKMLDAQIGNIYGITTAIGVLSAIVDNVPLVAAAMVMYGVEVYQQDHTFWQLLALCAGTGGSILIIGSAAGVAVMGILKINFGWYIRKMSLPATLGYVAAIGTFWLMNH